MTVNWNKTDCSVRFQGLIAVSMKMAVFWVVVSCSLVEVYRSFRDACCLHHQGNEALMMEAASISETLVNFYQTIRHNPEDSHLHDCSVCVNEQILSLMCI
jgi:hypothetical protein